MAYFSRLFHRSLISISGKDARAFLQGLVSVDVLKLEAGQAAYGLLLTPQGKFLNDMFIVPFQDVLLLDVAADEAEALLKRLQMFRLKRDVSLELLPDWQVSVCWHEGEDLVPLPALDAARVAVIRDPRLAALGLRLYSPEAIGVQAYDVGALHKEIAAYEALRLALGVPCGSDMIAEKSFPLDFDMDDLHAIDYQKGCYIGQEVTARMHYKAEPKKGVYIVTSVTTEPLPKKGTEIIAHDLVAGILLSVSGGQGLAMLKHDIVQQLPVGTIHASSHGIQIHRPAWAKKIGIQAADTRPEGV